MIKHKNYQNYLIKVRENGIKPLFRKFTQNNSFLDYLYTRLTNISVKKLNSIPNIKTALSFIPFELISRTVHEIVKKP